MFTKILIANRGEIAVRIARSAGELGIETVAVYSEADQHSQHVRVADEAVGLGAGPASENYLNGTKIIEAAIATGAQAIHPGYGFLSENGDFAEAVAAAGLTFIGPPASAIRRMGEKVAARAVAVAAEVPLAPGSRGAVESAEYVRAFGGEHGYPVLIKAAHGGGGRGMRVVRSADEAEDAFDAAVREAVGAFGNGEVYVERYLENARHVEVQVFADDHGNTVFFGDRDCSVQRRHQKLIEEAPAPGLSAEMRQAMGDAAVRLAREVGYRGAGTVEFLVEDDRFYFLEMNTRIQVEHPVTEAVTGLDLVAEQIRVAAGEPLSATESLTAVNGAAIEARINAEDVAGGQFFPAPGPISALEAPQGEGIRWDAGFEAGDEVLPYYDSLVGKLIVWAPTRDEAIAHMLGALDGLRIEGIETTVPAARVIVGHPDFAAVDFGTLWLERSVSFDEEEIQDRSEVEVLGRWYRIPVFADGAPVGAAGAAAAGAAAGSSQASGGPRRTGGGRAKKNVDDGTVKAPMQGTVVKVNVDPGDTVAAGQTLFVFEAMKMENLVQAPSDGVIASVLASVGDSLAAGAPLAEYEKAGL
ncbi:MAG: acetyl-CoA carboxylase biotin carboxylase subunit [Leucobacter sp.]